MSLHEVLSIIEDEADDIDHADVYITPPGDGQNSDEDSGDDDEADKQIYDSLLRKVLNETVHSR